MIIYTAKTGWTQTGINICFSAVSYLEDYKFSPPHNGEINGVKLVHTTGGVTCANNAGNTNWG